MADPGYNGVLTLKPVSAGTEFKTYWVPREPYELAELAEVIPEGWRTPRVVQTASRPRDGGISKDPTAGRSRFA